MKKNWMFISLIMFSAGAFAQTEIHPQTQIDQTNDYVDGVMNQISSADQVTRFLGSSDYARVGPELQNRVKAKLAQFRKTMGYLSSGPLAIATNDYNRTVRDPSISNEKKEERLKGQYQALEIQMRAAETAYRAALKNLYQLEPSWILSSTEGWNRFNLGDLGSNRIGEKYVFADGTVIKRMGEGGALNGLITAQIAKTLRAACASQFCVSSMVGDYSFFFSSVLTQVDRPLTIVLLDNKMLSMEGTRNTYQYVVDGVSKFSFDTNEFLRLPDVIEK